MAETKNPMIGYNHLLKKKIIFIIGQKIDNYLVNFIMVQLLFLESKDQNKDSYLYINNPNRVVTTGLVIYEII